MLWLKTDAGTFYATRWERGLAIGKHRGDCVCSLETSATGAVVLLVNDEACKRAGVKIVHTDDSWEESV